MQLFVVVVVVVVDDVVVVVTVEIQPTVITKLLVQGFLTFLCNRFLECLVKCMDPFSAKCI